MSRYAMLITLLFVASWFPRWATGAADEGPGATAEYRLGPGDVISVGVFGVPGLTKSARISNSGKFHFPNLGVLQVAGMTAQELEADIARRLTAAGLVKNPTVQVVVTQYRAQPVYILGEVMMPGQFVITDEMRVLDLLTLTAGLNEAASDTGYLYRRKVKDISENGSGQTVETTNEEEVIPLDLPAITSGANPSLNLMLRGGDILYVPARLKRRYFVVGDVQQTGAFEIPTGQRLLAMEAIAKAGGPTRTAKTAKGLVIRYDGNGARQEIALDLNAILKGKRQDMEIVPNDVIYVPGSSAKTLGYGLLNMLPTTAGRLAVIR
jgi:polysaccharide export outer membrane protein